MLYAFTAQAGYEDDGQRSPRTWLKWQTQVGGAAYAAMTSMQRLAAHPAMAEALAAGEVSASWARQIWEWTDVLPGRHRRGADAILLAAGGGWCRAEGPGRVWRRRWSSGPRGPDRDGDDDGFRDRSLSLGVTMGGAGKLRADLTPQATAALQAVLEALGKRAGPEDLRQ